MGLSLKFRGSDTVNVTRGTVRLNQVEVGRVYL